MRVGDTFRLGFAVGVTSLVPAQCVGVGEPPVPPGPPPCPATYVIMASVEGPLDCDINPPQELWYYMDDPGPTQVDDCLGRGGRPGTDKIAHREVCRDIDY